MKTLTKITRTIKTFAYLLENPRLFILRQQGGDISTFIALNQPWLHDLMIATVIDIGANKGQFALTIHALFPEASIYSFEPLPDCYQKMLHRLQGVKNFSAYNIGIGDSSDELTFQANAFTPSSSFLPMKNAHKELFPFTQNIQKIKVKVQTLDSITQTIPLTEPLLIKIDVQGYEKQVLRGGEQTIKQAKIIIIETSFEELYEGQALFDEIYRQLTDWGFVYVGCLHQLYNPQDGRALQADSLFLKCLK
jgi:FkbM family methyltransferase